MLPVEHVEPPTNASSKQGPCNPNHKLSGLTSGANKERSTYEEARRKFCNGFKSKHTRDRTYQIPDGITGIYPVVSGFVTSTYQLSDRVIDLNLSYAATAPQRQEALC